MRLAVCLLACASANSQETARWAFTPAPDDFRSDALLDLRYLNEKTAGENGFVGVDANGDFVLGDGRPARFWAVNTTVNREWPFAARPQGRRSAPDLARHARFLAKRGVNMVRCHAHINPPAKANPDLKITDINAAERDWIWRTVAAMKKEGIYTTISPYWPNTMEFSPKWNFPGGDTQAAHGMLFFEETLQEAYRAWMRALLTETNPYTGIPLARDPAVAIIQLQNEDSLLFYTVNNLKGPVRENLCWKWSGWVAAKYGSVEAALRAWSNNSVRGDDARAGYLELHNLWEMTQNRTGGFARRLDDQLQFWAEMMYQFHLRTADYLRNELGCRQLVNATNWKSGDPIRLEDAERWTYTANEVIAKNRYFAGVHNGPNRGWAIIRGDEFTSPSILKDPRAFPLNLKQVEGRPMMITESAWVMPNAYATEGPFLVAAYQSLTGIDGFYWFSTADDEWSPPQSANGYLASQQKWLFGSPDMLGAFPAAALLYRMNYLRRGVPVVREVRVLADLWQRRTPIIGEEASYDPNRDSGDIAPRSGVQTGVDGAAFLAGEVRLVFEDDPANTAAADLSQLITNQGKTVRSVTGEILLDSEKNFCAIDAPKAQGVAAFFANQPEHRLSTVTIRSGNEYGAVLVVALDDRPLAESRRILVQVGTQSRPTGWAEAPKSIKLSDGSTVDGFQVVEFGRAPWQVVSADVEITIANPNLARAAVLDMNGNARGTAPLERAGAAVRLRFPSDAMYVLIE